MSVELTMLVWSVALLFVLILIQATAGTAAQGLLTMAGNRDNLAPPKPFQGRTLRIVQNHIEGLVLFAPLVLVAAHQNISTSATVLGAQLFFYSRLAHAAIYVLGIPWLRTLAWIAGIVGTAMIFIALVAP